MRYVVVVCWLQIWLVIIDFNAEDYGVCTDMLDSNWVVFVGEALTYDLYV